MSPVRRRLHPSPPRSRRPTSPDVALGAAWAAAAVGLAAGGGGGGRRSGLRGALAAVVAAAGARLVGPADARRTAVPVAALAGFGSGAVQELPVAAAGVVPA